MDTAVVKALLMVFFTKKLLFTGLYSPDIKTNPGIKANLLQTHVDWGWGWAYKRK